MSQVNATGRRKAAVARVYLKKGKGSVTVNTKSLEDYFPVKHIRNRAEEPIKMVESKSTFDITIRVAGGGLNGQADAVRLGIARALLKTNPDLRAALKEKGMLTRDPRKVERKKAGFRKARKKEQYSKR